MKEFNVAVVGATGAVGLKMIEILEERKFPVKSLRLFASERSKGKKLKFRGSEIQVEVLKKDALKGVDVALLSAGGGTSREYSPNIAEGGAVVIDNSSAWRMEKEVPLVVPEVNPDDVMKHRGIIANPNCSTIQMVVALKPIHDAAGIKRVVVSTYQSVSGKGMKAIEELMLQSAAIVRNEKPAVKVFPKQIAFNLLPHIDDFIENGYTKEEMKMHNETRKIMGDDSIRVTATTVRVPVYYAHSEAVNVETVKKISPAEVRALLSKAPGVIVMDDPGKGVYPTALDATGRDEVFVGRIRYDESIDNGINMWVVSDNIRKGAALNAVQIAELLAAKKLI